MENQETSFQDIREILKELALSQAKTYQKIKEMSKSFQGFTDNQGSMIENLFFESLKGDMLLDDISYYDITFNLEIENKK